MGRETEREGERGRQRAGGETEERTSGKQPPLMETIYTTTVKRHYLSLLLLKSKILSLKKTEFPIRKK